MKAIKELINYFISRGIFTEDEIQRMKDMGYLKPDEKENDLIGNIDIDESLQPELAHDEGQSIEEELSKKRIKVRSKVAKKNQLKVSDLNHQLKGEINGWKPKLDGLLVLLSVLNDQSKNFRSLSIDKINEDKIKSLLAYYLAKDPEFIISLWNSISFDGYLGLFNNKAGIGVRIYKLICRGDNILDLAAYRFCLKHYYIKLFQCIVLTQRLALKILRIIFNESPDLVLNFLRKTKERDIINTFLLYDIVSQHLLEFNKISCIISEEPFWEEGCRKFETSASGELITWGDDKWIEQWNLKNYSRTRVDNVYCEPEFCINGDASLVAFYLNPFKNGTYQNRNKIFIFKKRLSATAWQKWKKLSINEMDSFGIKFHPDGQRLVIARSDGQFILLSFSNRRTTRHLNEEKWDLTNIEFSHDGKIIYLAGRRYDKNDDCIKFDEITACTFPEFRRTHSLSIKKVVRGLSVSPDGNYLAFFGDNSKLTVWDLTNNKTFELIGHKSFIASISFGCHNNILASVGFDKIIRLWDVSSQRCFEILDMKKFGQCRICHNESGECMKLALLKNDLIFLDNSKGLFIFKIHISRETYFSGKSRHISKWASYLGEYWLNKIDFDKKVVFNALTMDGNENSESYSLLIKSEINSLICNNTFKNE